MPRRAPEVVAEAIGGKVVAINGLGKDVIADIDEIAGKIALALKESTPRRHGEHGEKREKKGTTDEGHG